MSEIVIWHFAFFIMAAHFVLLDRKDSSFVRKLRIMCYNITSKPENQVKSLDYGWVYGAKIRSKIVFATVFSTILSIVFSLISDRFSLPMEVIMVFTKTTTVVLGFYSSFILDKIYFLGEKTVDTIESIENGETKVEEIYDRVKTSITGKDDRAAKSEEEKEIPKEEFPDPTMDDAEIVGNFKNRLKK